MRRRRRNIFSHNRQWLSCRPAILLPLFGLGLPSLGLFRYQTYTGGKGRQDARRLSDIFGRIENFFRWLEEYTEMPTTEAMKNSLLHEDNG